MVNNDGKKRRYRLIWVSVSCGNMTSTSKLRGKKILSPLLKPPNTNNVRQTHVEKPMARLWPMQDGTKTSTKILFSNSLLNYQQLCHHATQEEVQWWRSVWRNESRPIWSRQEWSFNGICRFAQCGEILSHQSSCRSSPCGGKYNFLTCRLMRLYIIY